MSKVLITGASGLIGSRLTDILLEQIHQVVHLGRSARQGRVKSFIWDVEKQTMDASSLEGVNAIVHLAGAGVADKRWTVARKKEILDSRVQSTELLLKTLQEAKHSVKTLVAASAIGYYGFGLGDELFTEDSPPGRDFLAQVTQQWEAQVSKVEALGIRVVKIRVGIVLSDKGGALVEMARPIKWGLGAPLGTGKQMMSWIHIDDLCELFAKAITDAKMTGVYNGVAPQPVTNKELTVAIAKVLKRPLWLPNVPSFVLQLLVGEMGVIVVNGSNVSAKRVSETGFEFQYPKIEGALSNLMNSH